jgi:hypothetical protein
VTPRLLLLLLLAWPAAVPAFGQDEGEERLRIELRVTASAPGPIATVDRGKSDGLAEGDRVTFHPRQGGTFTGVISRVDERTATVRLDDLAYVPEPGTRGEALIPRSRVTPPAPAPVPPPIPAPEAGAEGAAPQAGPEGAPAEQEVGPPAHAPWENQDAEWSQDMPLLAGVKPVKPDERARLYSGRFTLFTDGTFWTENDRYDAEVRAGTNLAVENPFGRGGTLEFDAEFDAFTFTVPDADDDDKTKLRLDRLSYVEGGTRFEKNRLEGGRFLQHGMPEFGYLDGVEWTRRTDAGHRYGASFGFMPELDVDFQTGDDLQAAGFYEWNFDRAEELSLAAGAQKTWHDGKPDRDLIVTRFNYIPAEDWDLRSTVWVDLYDSGDDDDKPGAEITEALVSTSRTYDHDGVTLTYRRLRFPDLLRNEEFVESVFEDLDNSRYDRLSLSTYHETPGRTRLHSTAGLWDDEDESGGDFEIGADIPHVFVDDAVAGISFFFTRGAFSVDGGIRLNYGLGDDAGRWDFYYVYADRHQDDFSHESDDLWEHTLRASRAFYLPHGWYMSADTDVRYFDGELAFSAALYVQKTF